ncbi:hypothetical protein AMET1_0421 [Methanonatronarchaeum thermophilum]|uniref:Uncharacterized protein n=1 Tax=Methanonatronarchaeum thermophilum TaxID=1927129 RepID=A0A1Y3GC00_9EURY|nr:hypothetical protein [Methanonatronarchaeum thermophilum]OUJ18770.1 hypothetical protein AMET1_0421 [Methanonatronarchaeum thermophilum]
MKRRLNFTGRRKIDKKNVSISVEPVDNDSPKFNANLDFSEMNFPEGSKVYIDAKHKTEWKRFDFGETGDLGAREKTILDDIALLEGLKFRVLVVDNEKRIIGLARAISPKIKDENRNNLLPVKISEMDLLWDLDYPGSRPELHINEDIKGSVEMVESDSAFRLSVFPEVLRRILYRIVFWEDEVDDPKETSEWHKEWLEFAAQFNDDMELPNTFNPENVSFDSEKIDRWIDIVVDEFAINMRREWNDIEEKDFGSGSKIQRELTQYD